MSRAHNLPKEKRELYYVSRFIKAICNNHESISPQKPPEPDFALSISDRIIGIEETQVLYVDDKGFNRAQYVSTCEAITIRAKELFESYETHQSIDVCISYANHSGTTNFKAENLIRNKMEQESLALEIARLVINNMPWVDGHKASIDHFNPYYFDKLSPKIDYIHIYSTTGKHSSLWTNSYAGVCPELTLELIEQIIKKKNPKPQNYRTNYSEIWLLLTINRSSYAANYVTDGVSEVVNTALVTPFNRVFIFDIGDENVIELNVEQMKL